MAHSFLLLSAYPPGLHQYGIEKALRQLGHRVFTAGSYQGDLLPALEQALQRYEPGYQYDLMMAPDEPLSTIITKCPFQPDCILYLESGVAVWPEGMIDAPCPVLGLLAEDLLHADLYSAVIPYFDLALCTWKSTEVNYRAQGHDNVVQWFYGARPEFCVDEGLERIYDVTFLGNLNPRIQRRRLRAIEKILRLREEGISVHVGGSLYFQDYNRVHCQSKIVYHQGITDQVNMRVFEAMGAGCLVIMRRPADPADPTTSFFKDREEVVYCDSDEEALDLIRYYLRHDDERRRIAEAGYRKVLAEHNYIDVARRLTDEVLPQLPQDFMSARHERLARFGKDRRRQRLDAARYYLNFGALQACQAQIRAIQDFETDFEALNLFGLLFASAQDPDHAVLCFQHACALNSQAILLRVNLASVGMTFKHPLAERWYEEALALLERVDPTTLPSVAFEGPYYPKTYDRFRMEVSQTYFTHPSGAERNIALARLYRYRLHSLMGRLKIEEKAYREALPHIERALSVLPDDGYLLYDRVQIHAAGGDAQKVLDDVRMATELEPFFAEAQYALAVSLEQQGRNDEAFAQYWVLAQHYPQASPSYELWQKVGELALRLGKREEARRAFEKALELKPDSELRERVAELGKGSDTPLGATPEGADQRAVASSRRANSSRGMRHVPSPSEAYFDFPRPEVAALVPQDARRILDVGCGGGALGALLKQRGDVEVIGIESQAEAIAIAEGRIDRVVEVDLDSFEQLPVEPQHFDCMIFADVLEHLLDPERVLSNLLRYLKPMGSLVISLPNIRNEQILVDLLVNGRWQYQPAGILDATHLRFFTLHEIQELLDRLGLVVDGGIHASTSPPTPALETLANAIERLGGDRARFLQESRAIQFIFRARPALERPKREIPFPRQEMMAAGMRQPREDSPFREKRIALIYDDSERTDTAGEYCRRALETLCQVEHFLPSQLGKIPTGFDLYLNIDDGLEYFVPAHLRPAAWWVIDTHLQYHWDLVKAKKFDVVFCAQKDGAERLKGDGVQRVVWLPLACDPEIHSQHPVEKVYDVAFVGTLYPGPRLDLVNLIREHFPSSFIGQAYFEEMSKIYGQARMVFNRSVKNDVNMRVFEALACGSLLITNDLSDNGQAELFKDKEHLVTYRNPGELVARVRFYLEREDERERIAARGREEVLAKHTYAHRVRQILETCLEPSTRPPAAIKSHSRASIVILAWNQLEYTRQCVESVLQWTRQPYELILVDNGSTDGTLDYFRSIPGAKVVANGTNLGFAAGNNRGMQIATGEYVVVLNNDTIVTPDWLEGMIACAEEDPTIGVVGPMSNWVSGPQQVPEVPYRDLSSLWEYARNFRDEHRGRRIQLDRIVGFCMMLRRHVVARIGLLDERFGIGNFEDDDYCLRAKLAGFRLVVAADVFIHHYGSRTFLGQGIDFVAAMKHGQQVFSEKWNGKSRTNGRSASSAELLEAGRQRLAEEKFQEAIELFKTALNSEPSNAAIWNELGCAEALVGQTESAELSFMKAISLGLVEISAQANLASLYTAEGRYLEAISLYEQLLAACPDIETLLDLADCYRQMGSDESARLGYQRVLEMFPEHPRALAGLGMRPA